jgi:gliding motility-associated-like protein
MRNLKTKLKKPWLSSKISILSFLSLCLANLACAQQIITFAGAQQSLSQSSYIGWSVGELLIQPLTGNSAYLTQGFRQPLVAPQNIATNGQACARLHGLTIYNGLTPNADQYNGELRIDGIEQYPSNHLYIFNRWGTAVFKRAAYSKDTSDAWRGTDQNGTPLPTGIYYYRLYLNKDDQQYCEGRILILY